jgi:hypothetical protein
LRRSCRSCRDPDRGSCTRWGRRSASRAGSSRRHPRRCTCPGGIRRRSRRPGRTRRSYWDRCRGSCNPPRSTALRSNSVAAQRTSLHLRRRLPGRERMRRRCRCPTRRRSRRRRS